MRHGCVCECCVSAKFSHYLTLFHWFSWAGCRRSLTVFFLLLVEAWQFFASFLALLLLPFTIFVNFIAIPNIDDGSLTSSLSCMLLFRFIFFVGFLSIDNGSIFGCESCFSPPLFLLKSLLAFTRFFYCISGRALHPFLLSFRLYFVMFSTR